MEIEQITPQIVGKKLWKIVRIVFYMMIKGMSKSKLMLDLNLMLKRGKFVVAKALSDLTLRHYSAALTCRSGDSVRVFTGRHDYEFSCSNSPAGAHKRKNRRENRIIEADVFQRVFEMLNDRPDDCGSPFAATPATVRQLRVTDSPFPVKDNSEEINSQVDIDAEEFIKKFYRELNRQKKIAALESPSPYHIRAR